VRLAAAACAAVMLLLAPIAAFAESAPIALDMRIAGDDTVTRIVIEFDKPVEVSHQLLDRPWRLVLDFNKIGYGFDADAASTRPASSRGLRYGDMGGNHSRLIFRTRHPFKVRKHRHPSRTGKRPSQCRDRPRGHRPDEFAEALDRSITTSAVVNTARQARPAGVRCVRDDRPFTIIIDPGHGGIDNGAKGVRGTLEKDVVLAFAKTLRDRLSRYGGAQVFMTRDSDVFVSLSDRTVFAREHQADLFISVHADSLRQHGVRGATVYTISEKASDEVAAAVAANENLADSVAGVEMPEDERACPTSSSTWRAARRSAFRCSSRALPSPT
jgi:N-acetylmuramoyl-L-alanine amidase